MKFYFGSWGTLTRFISFNYICWNNFFVQFLWNCFEYIYIVCIILCLIPETSIVLIQELQGFCLKYYASLLMVMWYEGTTAVTVSLPSITESLIKWWKLQENIVTVWVWVKHTESIVRVLPKVDIFWLPSDKLQHRYRWPHSYCVLYWVRLAKWRYDCVPNYFSLK